MLNREYLAKRAELMPKRQRKENKIWFRNVKQNGQKDKDGETEPRIQNLKKNIR